MKKIFQYGKVFLIFGLILCCYPDYIIAHGTGHRLVTDSTTVTIEFFYSDNEPMSYAEVFVFGPQDLKVEYQNGRTDRKGRFSVYPSIPGAWRIEASDGMGHKEVAVFEVQQEMIDKATSGNIQAMAITNSNPPSIFLKAITGLSLILNLFLIIYIWKTRKSVFQISNMVR
jgi:nickel transport protein